MPRDPICVFVFGTNFFGTGLGGINRKPGSIIASRAGKTGPCANIKERSPWTFPNRLAHIFGLIISANWRKFACFQIKRTANWVAFRRACLRLLCYCVRHIHHDAKRHQRKYPAPNHPGRKGRHKSRFHWKFPSQITLARLQPRHSATFINIKRECLHACPDGHALAVNKLVQNSKPRAGKTKAAPQAFLEENCALNCLPP